MAGLSGVPYRVYAPTAALAALIWSSLYYWLGFVLYRQLALLTSLGAGRIDLVSDWTVVALLLLLIVAVAAAWYTSGHWRRRPGKPESYASPDEELGARPDAGPAPHGATRESAHHDGGR
jgi:hypothetical protein